MATQLTPQELDLQEQLARIRKTQAEIDRMFDEQQKLRAEDRKLSAEARLLPVSLIFQAMLAGAALLGAGAAIAKLFFPG